MLMLTQDEQELIEELLTRAITLHPSPRQSLASALYLDLGSMLGQATRRECWSTAALRLCSEDGWQRDPTALSMLIEKMLPEEPTVLPILERLQLRPLPRSPANPFDALVLADKRPFIDRDPMRAVLRKLLDRRPRELVVVVNGERRSGKSYLAEYLRHALEDLPDTTLCPIRIEPQAGRPSRAPRAGQRPGDRDGRPAERPPAADHQPGTLGPGPGQRGDRHGQRLEAELLDRAGRVQHRRAAPGHPASDHEAGREPSPRAGRPSGTG